jgi:hypothetical protein
MAISTETRQQFNKALTEEFGITLSSAESDMMLKDLVGYFRLLQQLEKKHNQASHETKN